MALLTALVVLPWSIRNRVVFGRLVIVRSNVGLELRIAQQDAQWFDAMKQMHPVNSEETRALVRRVGEPAAHAKMEREAFGWILHHPRIFALRTASRIAHFWIPGDARPRRIISFLVAASALIGFLLLLTSRNFLAASLIASIWATYPTVYYLVQPLSHYQQPIAFTLYLMAAFALVQPWERIRVSQRKMPVGISHWGRTSELRQKQELD